MRPRTKPYAPQPPADIEDYRQALHDLACTAKADRVIMDTPIGTCLMESGGRRYEIGTVGYTHAYGDRVDIVWLRPHGAPAYGWCNRDTYKLLTPQPDIVTITQEDNDV